MKYLIYGCVGLAVAWAVTWSTMIPAHGDDFANRSAGHTSETKNMSSKTIYSKSGHDITQLSDERIAELAQGLTPEQRRILLDKDTERKFCGNLWDNKKEGVYLCRLCGLPLFGSLAKFESNTGWPSFFQPVDPAHIHEQRDLSHGMVRTEIQCARCRSHLGHVFGDGPPPTGQRYCLNSASMEFLETGEAVPAASMPAPLETAYFAGGCFWGIEDRFQQVPGVVDAVSGYMNGKTANPTYKEVCSDQTGHAEAVRVVFDSSRVTYDRLLEWFFTFHDPTQLNRQGPDVGSQYRSAIFATSEEQQQKAQAYVDSLKTDKAYINRRVVTQIEMADTFYEAEEYHQDYHAKHGGSCALPTARTP